VKRPVEFSLGIGLFDGPRPGSVVREKSADKRTQVIEPKTWMCLICGWIYDEAAGDPEHDIAPGTAWEAVPMNWTCPECGARKEDFEMVQI
jgi:rubredoxin